MPPEKPTDGKSLISYGVHFRKESVNAPHPSHFFFTVDESEKIFARSGVPPEVLERWRDDPVAHLFDFWNELLRLETEKSSNRRRDGSRPLTSRETAIIVARFLTYGDGEEFAVGGGDRAALVRARQAAALDLPGRKSPTYRRFDADRSLASTGHYWNQFAGELEKYLSREARREKEKIIDSLPADTKQLLSYSERYAQELHRQIFGPDPNSDLYVHRTVEDHVVSAIDQGAGLAILRGEAGAGKSSVLWSLFSTFQSGALMPVLISATWMVGGFEQLLKIGDLVAHFSFLVRARLRPILLLDTADLLLHSEGSTYQTIDLITRLRSVGVTIVLTVRPIEEISLPYFDNSVRQEIGGYSDDVELPHAILALMRQHLPQYDPQQGLDIVSTAQARGLPVLAIFRSPLLLRMLFDLSDGELPSIDLDVSDLYERYWHLRITKDRRSARYADKEDLSNVAARVGLLMLADGRSTLGTRRIETTLGQVAFPVALPQALPEAVTSMTTRGVLVPNGDEWRFAHQTLLEFAAAKGLLMCGADEMARRLLQHLSARSHDLFTGAVMEQLLILMASDASTMPTAISVTRSLLLSEHPSLRQIGVVAWCHLLTPIMDDELLEALDAHAAVRLLDHLPQVRQLDPSTTCGLLEEVWRRARDTAHRPFVSCLLRLIQRWPGEISTVTARLNVVEYVIAEHSKTQTKPDGVIELVMRLHEVDTVYAQSLAIMLLVKLPDAAGRVKLLHRIAERWPLALDERFVEKIIEGSVRSETQFPASRRSIGIACGEILYQHRRLLPVSSRGSIEDWWGSFATRVIDEMFSGKPTMKQAAERHALGRHLCESQDFAYISAVMDSIFGREAEHGPPQIAGSFLFEILASPTLATQVVTDQLYDKLVEGLPAKSKTAKSSAERWAITARAMLEDAEMPSDVLKGVTEALLPNEPLLWRRPEYLLSVLLPAAHAAVPRAAALARDISHDPTQLSGPGDSKEQTRLAQNELLQNGTAHATRGLPAAQTVLAVALHARRMGSIRALLDAHVGREAARTRIPEIATLVESSIGGDDRDQTAAAGLMQQLQAHDLVAYSVGQLADYLSISRHPSAQASLIEMLPSAVRSDPEQATVALTLIQEYVLAKIPESEWSTLSGARRRLVDSGFTAYRGILAQAGTFESWEPLWTLVCRPPLHGRGVIQADRFRDVASFIASLDMDTATGAGFAADRIVEVGRWLSTHTSDKQSRVISNYLATSARRLVRGPHPGGRRTLILNSPSLPLTLAETVVVTAVSGREAGFVRALVQDGTLRGALADTAVDRLRGHREAGFERLTWLLKSP